MADGRTRGKLMFLATLGRLKRRGADCSLSVDTRHALHKRRYAAAIDAPHERERIELGNHYPDQNAGLIEHQATPVAALRRGVKYCAEPSASARAQRPASPSAGAGRGEIGEGAREGAAAPISLARSRPFLTGSRSGCSASQSLCSAKSRGSGVTMGTGKPSWAIAIW